MMASGSLRVAPAKHKPKSQVSQRYTNVILGFRPRRMRLLLPFPQGQQRVQCSASTFWETLRDQVDVRMRLEAGL